MAMEVDETLRRNRRRLRRFIRLCQRVLIPTTVRGLEHIPAEGPLLILGNHMSSLDGPMLLGAFPLELDLESTGPGDFKLAWPGPWMIKTYGLTLIKRGKADRESLKGIIAHLKAGRRLLMFPDGGTWEKRLSEVKPGAAYVSQVTGAPILPFGLGGTYGSEDKLMRLRRPHVTVTFGEVMPPVPPSADRKRRDQDLQAASAEIMRRIYALLPPEDRARYDRWNRETYDLRVEFERGGQTIAYDGPPLPDLSGLGEFAAKPMLFRPMWQNARLPVEPFRRARFFAPEEVKRAAQALKDTLSAGDYSEYLSYRLGDDKSAQTLDALDALLSLSDWAAARGAWMKLIPTSKL